MRASSPGSRAAVAGRSECDLRIAPREAVAIGGPARSPDQGVCEIA
jgi:hypothetical protein